MFDNVATTIPTTSVAIVLAGLAALGWGPSRCATELDIPVAALAIDGAIEVGHAAALLDLLSTVGGAGAGARAGARIPPGALGLMDHLCGAAATGREALVELTRYFRLVASGTSLSLRGNALVLEMPPALSANYRRLLAQLLFALLCQRLRARGGPRITPTRVELPGVGSPAEELPWDMVVDRSEVAALQFATGSLDTPLVSADPSLHALLRRYASVELAQRPAVHSVHDQVVEVLIRSQPSVSVSASDVAKTLGMSGRSLRRALKAEGFTFSDVRTAYLRSVAEEALRDPHRTIGEVGWLLGYSEPSAFHRAFRRWTGLTPEVFRRRGQICP